LAFKLPFGILYTPNITPDPETGIGRWTPAEFLRAVRQGVGRGGKPLYPAFPYTSYALLTDQDVLAIRAYLLTLKPIYAPSRPNTLKFPYNQRALMIIWAHLFDANTRFRPIEDRSAQWNRGAYLVEALEHCGECHTPRNLMQAMDTRRKFAGGAAEGWTAYNITQDGSTGIGAWSAEEISRFLSSGHAAGHGSAGGPMAEAIDLSLSHLTPDDLAAIAAYLKTVPAIHSASLPSEMAGPMPNAANLGDVGEGAGKRIFEGACASCHAWSGSGVIFNQATLTGSRAINDAAATNVAQMILNGTGPTNGGRPFMPSFSAAYSDAEVADAVNYVTHRFGAAPSHLTALQVHALRLTN
jgi:mono/diheme cytochrome c family protein